MTREKIWTRDFIVISAISFVTIFMFYLLMVVIAPYTIDTYKVSTSVAGLVSSIFIIGALIGRLLAGRIISHMSPSKILGIGLITFFCFSIFYFIEFSVVFLLIVRLLQGISMGVIGTATGTIIAYILPENRKGEGIGYFSLSAILATAIGPFIGIYMYRLENGFQLMFAMNSLISLAIIIIYYSLKFNFQIEGQNNTQPEASSLIAKFIEPKSIPISFVALIIGFSYSGIMSFLSFYAAEINLINAASIFFLIYALAVILSRPVTGRIMDHRGPNIIVYPCLILFSVGMLLFSQATSSWMLLVAAVLIGLGYGNFNSIAQTIAIKVTEPSRYGLATSTYYILFDIGLGIGPFILGLLTPYITYRTMFLAMPILILICIPLYHILHGKKVSSSFKHSDVKSI